MTNLTPDDWRYLRVLLADSIRTDRAAGFTISASKHKAIWDKLQTPQEETGMNRWKIVWAPHTGYAHPTEVEAKEIALKDRAVVLYNTSSNHPVIVLPYENFRSLECLVLR